MKKLLLILAFCVIGLSASAQFWRFKRKPLPAITPVPLNTMISVPKATVPYDAVFDFELSPSDYILSFEETALIKKAKHHMRFREYADASYIFTKLANLYLCQNRFSEAKWYLLQSNTIARNAQNCRLLIDNLLILADIKTTIGENALALTDLNDAHEVAMEKGMRSDLLNIEKKLKHLQNNKAVPTKVELRYANAVEVANTVKAAPAN